MSATAKGISHRLWEQWNDEADGVLKAVERWHVEHDLPCPAETQFADAVILVRVGESMDPGPREEWATSCRVVMPCGNVYVIGIDYDVDVRGDRWNSSARTTWGFYVESAEVVR